MRDPRVEEDEVPGQAMKRQDNNNRLNKRLAWKKSSDEWELPQVVVAETQNEISLKCPETNEISCLRHDEVLFDNEGVVSEDLTSLKNLHVPAILHNLEERSVQNHPYTMLGTILISVNPVVWVGDPVEVLGSPKAVTKPHPYGIAERAFQQMNMSQRRMEVVEKDILGSDFRKDQSIIVSGESGSGKSEACKRVLRHLVTRCSSQGMNKFSQMENALLEATVVFENFGNALTTSNPNSSRFGKLLKLHFKNQKLDGARIDTYLLEKSRVTDIAFTERNYHCFYRLLAGASPAQRKEYALGNDFTRFRILNCCDDNMAAVFQQDAQEFKDFEKALGVLGLSGDVRDQIMKILAAILHMGEIEFDEKTSSKGEQAVFKDTTCVTDEFATPADATAHLLGISKHSLCIMLTEKVITVVDDKVKVPVNATQARQSKDGIIRAIYSALFEWVVNRINRFFQDMEMPSSPGKGPIVRSSIGVLDIFGFESFQENSLEQLLINFTNEALQATFTRQVFIAESNLYRSEGLVDECADNTTMVLMDRPSCMKLFLEHRNGILRAVEDLSATPQPTDSKLLSFLHRNCSVHPCYSKPHPRLVDRQFQVTHFAGQVSYTIEGFVAKNVDNVPPHAIGHLALSEDRIIVSQLFRPVPQSSRRGSFRQRGLCSKFETEIRSLVNKLELTDCSFVRCIKPNAKLVRETKRSWFDRAFVCRQLKYLSIPQTATAIVLRQGGFPTRIAYKEVYFTYSRHVLPKEALARWDSVPGRSQNYYQFAKALFWALEIDNSLCRFGLTKVFFRSGALAAVEKMLNNATNMNEIGRDRMVKRFCLYSARLSWRRCFAKVLSVNCFAFTLLKIRARLQAAEILKSFFSGIQQRRQYLRIKHSVVIIQCQTRKLIEQRRYGDAIALRREQLEGGGQQQSDDVLEVEEVVVVEEKNFEIEVRNVAVRKSSNIVNSQDCDIVYSLENQVFAMSQKLSAMEAEQDTMKQRLREMRKLEQQAMGLRRENRRMISLIVESQERERILLREHCKSPVQLLTTISSKDVRQPCVNQHEFVEEEKEDEDVKFVEHPDELGWCGFTRGGVRGGESPKKDKWSIEEGFGWCFTR